MPPTVLLIEPFYGGSHKQLIDLIITEFTDYKLVTLPSKKWHWRARTSALYFSQLIPKSTEYSVLFCSSVLNLAELSALRPDLAALHKVLYFHENQLVYPVRKERERDFQYGYNQILSCLVADVVVFNSEYNQESFLRSIQNFLKLIPDHRPKDIAEKIRPKCKVLYFPINLPPLMPGSIPGTEGHSPTTDSHTSDLPRSANEELSLVKENRLQQPDSICLPPPPNYETGKDVDPLHILWAHRWEHDKDPDTFFEVLHRLQSDGQDFRISVIGESFEQVPEVFKMAKERLGDKIVTWGYLNNKLEYYAVLKMADVAVSTAKHEFFGVAMLEAVHLGCYPLCPNRLVYPEIFPKECLYNTTQQLYKRLRDFCSHTYWVRSSSIKSKLHLERFSWGNLRESYSKLLQPP